MITNFSKENSIINQFIAELRDANIQNDRMRFRRNMERIGEIMAYELSKKLPYFPKEIETPLGALDIDLISTQPVIGAILRAGLPLHQGFLNYFDSADNAFISAYRKHHKDNTFEIKIEYISCANIEGRPLILCDPMLATGASMLDSIKALADFGQPSQLHIATIIASADGMERIIRYFPDAYVWVGAIDEELTAKSYIVPGLGDAGDLAFGVKMQD
jgi:uracil phosphoribosyltransferase